MRVKYENRTIIGNNLLFAKLEQKRVQLENYQTPRTGKEFYDTILEVFSTRGIVPIRKRFSKVSYSLHFLNPSQEELRVVKLPNGATLVDRIITAQDNRLSIIHIETLPAYLIPGLWKDILYGRNGPFEEFPLGVNINSKKYPIRYSRSDIDPLKIKFS